MLDKPDRHIPLSVTDSKTYGIYVGEKRYRDPALGKAWRQHRFLILSDETDSPVTAQMQRPVFQPEQELHYVRHRVSGLLRAIIVASPRPKDSFRLLGKVKSGPEGVVRGLWNRSLQVGIALNGLKLKFDDYRAVAEPQRACNCEAGLKACFDVMGHGFDFGHDGFYRVDLSADISGILNPAPTGGDIAERRRETARLHKALRASR
jgi:hypothetical protein